MNLKNKTKKKLTFIIRRRDRRVKEKGFGII